ncbi:MAG: hypothetical protein K2I48_04970 [Muribaculaceae bacterium]|nr:hypothetical protein [Muribaculaceae bacterium]
MATRSFCFSASWPEMLLALTSLLSESVTAVSRAFWALTMVSSESVVSL